MLLKMLKRVAQTGLTAIVAPTSWSLIKKRIG